MTDAVDQLPAPDARFGVGIATAQKKERLIHCIWGRDGFVVTSKNGERSAYEISVDSVGFEYIAAGRAPILWGHSSLFENYLGIIEVGWIEGGRIHIIARLGRDGKSNLILRNLWDGIPYKCSIGVLHGRHSVRRDGNGEYFHFHSYLITEMSLSCPHEAWDTTSTVEASASAFSRMLERKEIAAAELERQYNALDGLFAERLRGRASALACKIAGTLGLDPAAPAVAQAQAVLEADFDRFAIDTRMPVEPMDAP